MGICNFFLEGAKTVKGFVKAKLSPPKPPAGKVESPEFRQVGKSPADTSGFKKEHTK